MGVKQLWVVLTLVVLQGWWCYSCLEEERNALLQFKASIDHLYPYPVSHLVGADDWSWFEEGDSNPGWFRQAHTVSDWFEEGNSSLGWFAEAHSLSDWVGDGNCCNWRRVYCNTTTGRIRMLDLYMVRDWSLLKDWYLNISLFLPLKEIKVLDLSWNGITGSVENEGFERLSMLNNLEHLDLSQNRLDGSILSSLVAISSLKGLILTGNKFEGLINVEELNNLTRLTKLDLGWNAIQGFKSFQGGGALKLKNLEYLYLSDNRFDRSILSYISGLSSLIFLDLSINQLYGSVNVTELNVLRNLKELLLNGNGIYQFVDSTGDEGLLQMSKLQYLQLQNNHFDNRIFPSLRELSSLKHLYLGYNQIKGTIYMKELDTLSNLRELDLSGNNINKIVGSKGPNNFTNLKSIDLSSSKFEETIFDQDLQNFANVETLIMDFSSIEKNAFQSLRSLPSLRTLSMYGANVTLPAEGLSCLKNLEILDLSYSNITNSFLILKTIGRMPSLITLRLSNCGLSGTISTTTEGLSQLQHLQELYMNYNDLNGLLPSWLTNLTSLQILDVSSNFLSGNISFSPLKSLTSIQQLRLSYNHFQIPISLFPFFNLTQLKSLYAEDNEIYVETENYGLTPKFQLEDLDLSGQSHGHDGSFPKFLYHQHALHLLDLSNTNIKGEFPQWLLDNSTNLERLYLINNSLSGPLQLPIHPHLNLTHLDISMNFFHGQIPPTIASYLPGLSIVDMSNNNFNGSIPSSMDQMGSLFSLDLSNNQLQGRIPENLTKTYFFLHSLILSNNSISGGIPMSLSKYSLLRTLDVSNNRLSGQIPEWMGNMSSLEFLDLSRNDFSGALPHHSNPPSLQYVFLSRNHLQGSLTKAFYDCSQLITLDLSHNNFTGNIPDWITLLSQLSFLLLSYNNLEGEIPKSLCTLDQLSFMDLSHNNFSGKISNCLSVRPTSNHHTSQEKFKSQHPPQTSVIAAKNASHPPQTLEITAKYASYSYHDTILEYMCGIDLSCNNLKGEIPHEFGNLRDMKVLNLSHNSLVGEIPPTFSNLRQIETLDLSFNNLNGSIPLQLTGLCSLSAFSVAHNNLSGKTPDRVAQFATFEESSYRNNPFLCGPPLPKSCSEKAEPPSVPKDATVYEGSDGLIDMDVFWVTFVASYGAASVSVGIVLYINPRWRRTLFYLVEQGITNCYYFVVDNVPFLSKLGLS